MYIDTSRRCLSESSPIANQSNFTALFTQGNHLREHTRLYIPLFVTISDWIIDFRTKYHRFVITVETNRIDNNETAAFVKKFLDIAKITHPRLDSKLPL